MSVLDKFLAVSMPDGSRWAVPVRIVALNRAQHYQGEFDDDIHKSMEEDTVPLFESDEYEIEDWAANNMDWKEISEHAKILEAPDLTDFQDGWINGEKEIIDKPEGL